MSHRDFLELCMKPDQEGALALLDQHSDWLDKGLEGDDIMVNGRNVWLGSMEIIAAATAGSVGLIDALLKRGADVRKVDRNGLNALMEASYYCHVGAATLLLNRAPDLVESRSNDCWTPLHFAAQHDRLNIVQLLFNRGAQINVANNEGTTPVHFAARNNNLRVVKFLANRGAQIDAVDKHGQNALHIASDDGNLDICLFLISRGMDPSITNNKGQTALTIFGRSRDDNDPDDEDEEYPPLTDEEKQIAVAQMLTAREAYLQRVRDENWIKNWPLLRVLTHGGLRPMAAAMAVQAAAQAAAVEQDTSVSLPGIPLETQEQIIAFLNSAVLGREGEGLLRHIVSFIPRKRFEVGEGEEEEDEEGHSDSDGDSDSDSDSNSEIDNDVVMENEDSDDSEDEGEEEMQQGREREAETWFQKFSSCTIG